MAKRAKRERAGEGRAGKAEKAARKPDAKPATKPDAKPKSKIAGKPAKRHLAPRLQHAALCFRAGAGGAPEVLLITSRDTGRWVLPKGWPKKGESGGASALREAGEEAGVVGAVTGAATGTYRYDKSMTEGPPLHCQVEVHPVAVAYLDFRFPEMRERTRAWFSPTEAAAAVDEPELKLLLEGFTAPAMSAMPGPARAARD